MRSRLLVLALLFCGCSGQVDVSANSAGSAGSTGTTTSGAGTTTSGTGGSTGTGAGAGGSLEGGGGAGGGEVTTSGVGGGPNCPGVIDVDIDGNGEGPTVLLDQNCQGGPPSVGAFGGLGYLGEGGKKIMLFFGCAGAGDFGAPADFYAWADLTGPGTTQVGHAELTYFGKPLPSSDDVTLVIDSFGPVGGMIVGKLSFTVTDANGASMPFSVKIQACRHADFPPAP